VEAKAARWSRVLLKLSGEAFAQDGDDIIDFDVVGRIANEIVDVRQNLDVQVAVVVGGGNIWRGATGAADGMDRAQADYMGMLATIINSLALQDALERLGQPTRTQTAIQMAQIAEPYIRRRAVRHLEKGRVVILAAGIGSPFVTTDTGAAMRAVELEAQAVLKGTHGTVDGVYDDDPRTNPNAKKYTTVSYAEVLQRGLKVMDSTAISFCKDNNIPLVVFNVMTPGNIRKVILGDPPIGTLVS
jgi:uridylate kinase